jgi:hypothetical protein
VEASHPFQESCGHMTNVLVSVARLLLLYVALCDGGHNRGSVGCPRSGREVGGGVRL